MVLPLAQDWRMRIAWPNEKSLSNIATSNRSYRSLRDGSFSCSIPGSKLPGYYHLVPAGQNLRRPVHKIDATSTCQIEDECDDEYEHEDRWPLNLQQRLIVQSGLNLILFA
jgi:hypothetical protein